jgi:hypothetical protein
MVKTADVRALDARAGNAEIEEEASAPRRRRASQRAGASDRSSLGAIESIGSTGATMGGRRDVRMAWAFEASAERARTEARIKPRNAAIGVDPTHAASSGMISCECIRTPSRVKMYSVVVCEFSCPRCRSASRSEVQFRYGNLWLHRYAISDELCWGQPQVGYSYEAMVAADASPLVAA